ncbi:MAG: histone deacetylase [Dehalococcoidia bacterium]
MAVGFVTSPLHVGHCVEGHPEGPERLEAVLALLEESGVLDRMLRLEPRDATDEELSWVHPAAFVEALERACREGGGWADPDTYIVPGSCAAARQSAGACLEAIEAVLSGGVRSAFSAVRPPGHHARPAQAMGFCLMNNVAVAARFGQRRHGLERVAIVDIDVHHGNGSQDVFYDDPSVLYVSTHQYPFYPGTGPAQEIGAGAGRGANVNIPLPARSGDAECAAAFEQVVEPVVRRFRPELLLVSCGFDAHFADPLAGMSLSVDGYGALTQRLIALADGLCAGRIVFALEGGYHLTALPWGVRRVIELLLGETPAPDPLGLPADVARAPDVTPLLAEVRALHGL